MILDKINTPEDLKKFSLSDLSKLAGEVRKILIKKVNETGGHMGPNLGFIEPTIAMHYVFNSPTDKIVYDVSHQCYTHKILTGRKECFINSEKYEDISGFTQPKESDHDIFQVGHTSTGVSLATGLAKARDLQKGSYNVIAVVGDGSLSGGQAFEGLDNAATLNSNMIIVVNDNEMSIAENYGGLYQNLQLLRATEGKAECNFFKALGFEYIYVKDGNDLGDLITAFAKVKDSKNPVVVHLHTLKGKGLEVAEQNKETFHWMMPGTVENLNSRQVGGYDADTTEYFLNKKQKDNNLIVLTAGTPGATGFSEEFREKMGQNYWDVGICEEHAIAAISGLAKNGAKPVFAVVSSFVQRTYDQISQDLALNNNPATILVYWAGVSSADSTHLGCFDIPLISNIPNMVYLAPTSKEEYLKMLDWSVEQTSHPVAIRVPFGEYVVTGQKDDTDYSILNKYKVVEKGSEVAIIAAGNFFGLGNDVKTELKAKYGIDATLINPKFLTGIDEELLRSLESNHKLVITLENGVLDGGFGEKIARFYGSKNMKVLNFGAKKEFTDRMAMSELLEKNHLTKEQIADDVVSCLNKK